MEISDKNDADELVKVLDDLAKTHASKEAQAIAQAEIEEFTKVSVVSELKWLGLKFTPEEPSDWISLYFRVVGGNPEDDYYEHVKDKAYRANKEK